MPDRLSGRTLVIATGHELSLALLEDGRLRAERNQPMSRGHAEALVPMLAELVPGAARCDRLVVETGPGSFTGLRVGLAAARALALAWNAPLLGVRSTQLVAAAARAGGEQRRLLVALEAPRGQIWLDSFAAGAVLPEAEAEALDLATAARKAEAFEAVAGTAGALLRCEGQGLAPRAAMVEALAPDALGGAELLYVRIAEPA